MVLLFPFVTPKTYKLPYTFSLCADRSTDIRFKEPVFPQVFHANVKLLRYLYFIKA